MKQIIFTAIANPVAKGLVAMAIAAVVSTSAVADKMKLPEVSSDGLHLLKHSKVMVAYAKPGATLSKYTKVKLLDCYVAFAKNWQHNYNLSDVGLQGQVTDKDAERMKRELSAEFSKVFTKVLTKKGYQVVDSAGPDVLVLRPALINVNVTAPDVMTPGMSATFATSAGSMTLFMEMYDSATGTLLARVIDPRADQGGAMQASSVTNIAAADFILTRWADLLAKHLGEVMGETKKE